MKTDISFLPQNKQQELGAITTIIRDLCDDIEMIILYGSYARNEYKEAKDLKPDRWSGHVSDYDILAVTGRPETAQNRKLHTQIEAVCRDEEFSATARITLFDLQELNIRLAEGQYFYSDVKKEGIILYNGMNHILAEERELTSTEKARIAQDHFDEWFERAKTFSKYAHIAATNEDNNYAIFNLHQVSEACYKCILLVFTNYSPDEHYLNILERQAADEVPTVENLFPKNNDEQNKRFRLLDNAYIGARYIRDFIVEKEDIEYLAPLVENLLQLTKEECEERIKKLTGEKNSL